MKILYFAWLREKIGQREEVLEPPPDITTAGELITWLSGLDAGHAAAFAHPRQIRCAIDMDFAGPDAPILGAKEIAFFPPVTGG